MVVASLRRVDNNDTTASDMIGDVIAHTVFVSNDGHLDGGDDKGDDQLGSASVT